MIVYETISAKDDTDLGLFTALKHKNETGDTKPIKQKMRQVSLGFVHEEETHPRKMLECAVI